MWGTLIRRALENTTSSFKDELFKIVFSTIWESLPAAAFKAGNVVNWIWAIIEALNQQ